MEKKRFLDKFSWVPLHKRKGRFGFPLAVKEEKRKPLLWLTSVPLEQGLGREIFLVNDSEEILTSVRGGTSGFITADDTALAIEDSSGFKYENVQPGEAVKVEEYDEYYDLDYVLQIYLQVETEGFGTLNFSTDPQKGGLCESVLKWSEE